MQQPPSKPEQTPDPIKHQEAHKQVLVCQNRTCLKQGSVAVLQRFQRAAVPGYTILGCGCLGQCGNGPMVQVLPDNIWYWQVQPDEVPAIVQKHLIAGSPIAAMLYPPFHSKATHHP